MIKLKQATEWPFCTLSPYIVYYYKQIVLYPVTDSSTWPFPVRAMNGLKFQEAISWLAVNNIDILGTVEYSSPVTQFIHVKFTSEGDVLAFTLQFGDLLV